MVIIVAIVFGYLVWHGTRANQARLGIRSRRGQIKGMWREIRKFLFRGIFVLIVFIFILYVAVRY